MKKVINELKAAATDCRFAVDLIEDLDAEALEYDELLDAVDRAIKARELIERHLHDTTLTQIDAILDAGHDPNIEKCRRRIGELLESSDALNDNEEDEAELDDGGSDEEVGKELARILTALLSFAESAREIAITLDYMVTYLSARSAGKPVAGDIHNYHGPVINNSNIGGVALGDRGQAKGSVNFQSPARRGDLHVSSPAGKRPSKPRPR